MGWTTQLIFILLILKGLITVLGILRNVLSDLRNVLRNVLRKQTY